MAKLDLESYHDWHLATLGEDLRLEEIKKKYAANCEGVRGDCQFSGSGEHLCLGVWSPDAGFLVSYQAV